MLKVRKKKIHKLIGFEFRLKSDMNLRFYRIISFDKENFSIETTEEGRKWHHDAREEVINRLIENGDIIEEKEFKRINSNGDLHFKI